jgi:anti-anti-sigma factor
VRELAMSSRPSNLRDMKGSVELQGDPGKQTIVVSGDADLTSAPDLQRALDKACDQGDRVVVDLDGASLIDSRTIGVLAGCSEVLRDRGGELAIVCSVPDLLRLFRTIGLEGSFSFYPTRAAAHEGGHTSSI